MKILKLRARVPFLVSTLMFVVACHEESPTAPVASLKSARVAATRADSIAILSGAKTSGLTTITASLISLQRGDKVMVTVTSNECSGEPETANIGGVISGVVASGSCNGGLVGQSTIVGPASADGVVSFTATHQEYGTGPNGSVTGAFPDYSVGLNDGFGDTDFNDVVLSVHVIRAPGQLNCTSAVRGLTVTCTVTGNGVQVTAWTFAGPDYDNPGTVLKVTGPTTGNIWKGPAVVSGDVSAAITVNGVPWSTPLTASLSVQSRTGSYWTWGPGSHWQYTKGSIGAQPNCFAGDQGEPLLYANSKLFGWSSRKNTCDDRILTPNPFTTPNDGYLVKQATAGPNSGLWYIGSLTWQMLIWSTINPALTSGSSFKWTMSDPAEIRLCSGKKTVTQANFYFFNETCKANDVDVLIAGVWNHEGYGSNDGNGHEAQLERAAQLEEFELYRNGEAVYGIDEPTTRQSAVKLAKRIVAALQPIWLDHSVVRNNWTTKNYWFWIVSPPHFLDLPVYDQQ